MYLLFANLFFKIFYNLSYISILLLIFNGIYKENFNSINLHIKGQFFHIHFIISFQFTLRTELFFLFFKIHAHSLLLFVLPLLKVDRE